MAAPKNKAPAKPSAATPEQIAMFGHIAARLRAELDKRGWTPGDYNDALGKDRGNGNIYHWLGAKSAPGPTARAELADFFKIPEEQLMAKSASSTMPVKTAPGPRSDVMMPPAKRDVLNFSIDNEGMARIKCDVTLPALKGAALLQVLLNAGLAVEVDDAA